MIGTTVTQFLIEEQRKFPSATGDLTLVIRDIVTACKAIALAMRYGGLSEGDIFGVSAEENVHGETQKTLDLLANELFIQRTAIAGHVAGMVSEEMEVPKLPKVGVGGRYLLAYDPVDGSANLGEDAVVGTVFSVLRRPAGSSGNPTMEEFLQPGTNQVCAGYAIYGPSCMFVMTTGNGVNGFTLDPGLGEFLLTHPQMRVATSGSRFCVNTTHLSRWGDGIGHRLSDFVGSARQHNPEFDLRWSGCAVADVHRVLTAGGIYLTPVEVPGPSGETSGKLRLLYEVNPLSMIIEQAGGTATDGSRRILDIQPEDIHQQQAAILGSVGDVARLVPSRDVTMGGG